LGPEAPKLDLDELATGIERGLEFGDLEFALATVVDTAEGDLEKSKDLELASTGKAIGGLASEQRESRTVEFRIPESVT